MIAVMKREYTKEQIDAVVKIIEAGEAKPMISVGEGTTIIGVVRDQSPGVARRYCYLSWRRTGNSHIRTLLN